MYPYFKSEMLKMKHTFVGKLVFIAPVFAMLLALVLMPMYFQINSYNWCYVSIFPGMLSIGCTLVGNKDQKMKNRAVLSQPISLKKVWVSKVLVCSTMLIGACAMLFLGSSVISGIFNFNPIGRVTILNGLLASFVLAVTFLWQIPLCLFLGSKIGMFPTILINSGAYIILGVLAAPTSIWWLIPYAIPSRLMCPIIKFLPNGLPAVEGSMTFTPELLSKSVILPGMIITAVLFVVLTIVTAKWYTLQEAK